MAFFADRTLRAGKANQAGSWLNLWILLSAWCSLSGWFLSLTGLFSRLGYSIAFILFFIVLGCFHRQFGISWPHLFSLRLQSFRTRSWLPKMWLLMAALALIGGLLYHPNNYDYLTYRFPRLLHWAWDQKWSWIPTPTIRMNLAAPGFEWLMAPIFVFFQTDRLFFLINLLSFFLLPGVTFALFRRLGVSRRISWWWMWVLPSGYCYALQAGSVSNDLFATVYLLASFLYLLKLDEAGSDHSRCFFYSCLALALATGAKASNLPLGLPWLLLAVLQHKRLLSIRPVLLLGTFLVAGCISFFPTAAANIHFTGSYTGDPHNESDMQQKDPVAGLVGNALFIGVQNLRPPVSPVQVPMDSMLPASFENYLSNHYPRLHYAPGLDQIQLEETAGVGVGISACLLLMIALRYATRAARSTLSISSNKKYGVVLLGTAVALLVLMMKLCNEGIPRLITPYYPLLIASILAVAALDGTIIRYLICRIFAFAAIGLTVILMIISPARPLFPVHWAVAAMAKIAPSRVERMELVYRVYGSRYDAMKDVRVLLPAEKTIGILQSGDVVEAALWRPYGSREIVDVVPDETLEQLRAKGLDLIIVSEYAVKFKYKMSIEDLAKKWSATTLAQKNLLLRAGSDTGMWYLFQLPPPGSAPVSH